MELQKDLSSTQEISEPFGKSPSCITLVQFDSHYFTFFFFFFVWFFLVLFWGLFVLSLSCRYGPLFLAQGFSIKLPNVLRKNTKSHTKLKRKINWQEEFYLWQP